MITIPVAVGERGVQKLFSALLLLLNLIVMLLLAVGSNITFATILLYTGAFINLLSLLSLRFPAIFSIRFLKPRNVFFVDGIIWLLSGKIFVGILMMTVGILSFYIGKEQFLVFNEEGLSQSGSTTRKIKWSEVENVVVKNGIITVNLTNDRLIQEVIKENFPTASLNQEIEVLMNSSQVN